MATAATPAKPDQAEPTQAKPANGLARVGRALRHRNFRLYLSGQMISLMGTWMTRLALSWLTYRLTGSALMLGLVGFSGQILTFLLAPFAGVWVDRLDRRKLLVYTQIFSALQSAALAWLTLAGKITITEILALAALQGLIDAFDMPARQSFVHKMVPDKADLGNAIALNSSTVNIARLVGPPVAAFVIAKTGEGWCFFIDAVSYLAVIASLLMMRLDHHKLVVHATSVLKQMHEGWGYVSKYLPIKAILLMFSASSLLGASSMTLLPVVAAKVLHGGPHTLGMLTAANGTGALISAIRLASRKSVLGLLRNIQVACFLFGASLVVFGLSRSLILSMVCLAIAGAGMMQGLAGSNTIIQTLAPEDKRGRVMSFYTMAFIGMMPFGSLLSGFMASKLGVSGALMLSGGCLLMAALWFFLLDRPIREQMRPRYEELGIVQPRG